MFLDHGLKNDGHMISILFQKPGGAYVLRSLIDFVKQRRGISFADRIRGPYPFYKEPVGIIKDDRIVEIDPSKNLLLSYKVLTNLFYF